MVIGEAKVVTAETEPEVAMGETYQSELSHLQASLGQFHDELENCRDRHRQELYLEALRLNAMRVLHPVTRMRSKATFGTMI